MENVAVDILSTYGIYGIFGILFVFLLVYVLKTNEKRETALQEVLTTMSGCLPAILESCRKIEDEQRSHCSFVTSSMAEIRTILSKKC